MVTYGAAAAVLPWLQHRHLIVAPVFAAALALRVLADDRRAKAAGSPATPHPPWMRRAHWSARLLAPLALITFSCVVEVAYMLRIYGTLSYPAPPMRLPDRYSLMIALGMHLDQFHGLFFQNPLLFVGLAGLPRFARRTPGVFALWCVVYGLTILPCCLVKTFYGGWSFAGRYGWDLAPLWIFPLGHAAAWLLERRRGATILAALLATAAAGQLAMAWTWVNVDGFLIQGTDRPLWTLNSFYRGFAYWLPLFARPEAMFRLWPNCIWPIIALLVLATGDFLVRQRPRHAAAAGLAAYLTLTALTFVPPLYEPLSMTAAELEHTTGRDDGRARIATGDRDAAGFLIFGPYISISGGCYQAARAYESEASPDAPPAFWDTAAFGGAVVDRGSLPPAGPGGLLRTRIWVSPERPLSRFEFRVWFPGAGRMRIERLSITPDPTCAKPKGADVE